MNPRTPLKEASKKEFIQEVLSRLEELESSELAQIENEISYLLLDRAVDENGNLKDIE